MIAVQPSLKKLFHHHNGDVFCLYCFMMTCLLVWVYFHSLCWALRGSFQSIETQVLQFHAIYLNYFIFTLSYLSRAPISGPLDVLNCSSNFPIFSCLFYPFVFWLNFLTDVLNFPSNSSDFFMLSHFQFSNTLFYYECFPLKYSVWFHECSYIYLCRRSTDSCICLS